MDRQDIDRIIQAMNQEEKLSLLTGKTCFSTVGIERLGIPALQFADGPHGVRKVAEEPEGRHTEPAVCFPTASALAATWNPELLETVGRALGQECIDHGVDLLLGPGTNLVRSPLCGRNFEYFSEDPVLAGKLSAAYIRGVQGTGVGACLKHFAANNIEYCRMDLSTEADERTLREMYLKPFEIAVREAEPRAVMNAYNRLGGIFCSEHRWLLWDVLREEWRFRGIVISDWGSVHNRAMALKASMELDMPYNPHSGAMLRQALESGLLTWEEIDGTLARLVPFLIEAAGPRTRPGLDAHAVAAAAAEEAVTLLKNDGLLPFAPDRTRRVCLIGRYAAQPRFQGDGSSKVETGGAVSPLEAVRNLLGNDEAVQVEHYDLELRPGLMNSDICFEAVQAARQADAVVLFSGTRAEDESEMYDRTDLYMPQQDMQVLRTLLEEKVPVALVMMAGAAVALKDMPRDPDAVVHAWLGGEGVGKALAGMLFGRINPSGRLPVTFMRCLDDISCYTRRENPLKSWYTDGIRIGYRHFDANGLKPWFPFGHGLSYTTFAYDELELPDGAIGEGAQWEASCRVTNTGGVAGRETVQLYIGKEQSHVVREPRGLKAFAKIALEPGESRRVTFRLGPDALQYYNIFLRAFTVEAGAYRVEIGASSRDIRLTGSITAAAKKPFS